MGSFCCSVLPVPPVSASVARCGPNRAFVLVTQSVRTLLRGNRERLVVVGTCGCERFYGAFRPGKNTVFQYTSILVRPHQLSRSAGTLHACWQGGAAGGDAGYCPRVRCIYYPAHFITIVGRTRQALYKGWRLNVK